jgi:STE24 endopeptidase
MPGYATLLQQSLVKMSIENLSSFAPDVLYAKYYYSHPPLVERLNAISLLVDVTKKD